MTKKKWMRITFFVKDDLSIMLRELRAWGVQEKKYIIVGDSIITSDNNVIDVATETFRQHQIDIHSWTQPQKAGAE